MRKRRAVTAGATEIADGRPPPTNDEANCNASVTLP
jgi:hypothetical protein